MSAILAQGRMAQRISAFDWARTPLGDLNGWPPELLAAVNLVLDNPFPQCVIWGNDAVICAYNDAYGTVLGQKTDALGQPLLDVWKEAESMLAPLLRKALAGHAVWCEDSPFQLSRHGYLEDAC